MELQAPRSATVMVKVMATDLATAVSMDDPLCMWKMWHLTYEQIQVQVDSSSTVKARRTAMEVDCQSLPRVLLLAPFVLFFSPSLSSPL
jgi:hypothetical protein